MAVWGSLEPVTPRIDQPSWTAIAQPWVFEPLLRISAQGEIVPLLAARVETLASRKLRLWVRSDARFENGAPVRFEDVAASLAQNHLRATSAAGDGIIVESDQSGVPPEVLVARTPIFLRSADRFVGTGPFTLREQDGKHILLERRQRMPGRIDA